MEKCILLTSIFILLILPIFSAVVNLSPIPSENVSAYNFSGSIIESNITDSNGLTRLTLIEYVNTGTQVSYYSNYSISTHLDGWVDGNITFNVSNNSFIQFLISPQTSNPANQGGSGGGSGITIYPNKEICNYIYPYALNKTLFFNDTLKAYVDNWQVLCSDLTNLTIEPEYICEKSFYFLLNNKGKFTTLDLDNLKKQIKINISRGVLLNYIQNYNRLCNNYTPIVNFNTFSVIPVNLNDSLSKCSSIFSRERDNLFVSFFTFSVGTANCNAIYILDLFFKLDFVGGSVGIIGVRIWVIVIGLFAFLIFMYLKFRRRDKK